MIYVQPRIILAFGVTASDAVRSIAGTGASRLFPIDKIGTNNGYLTTHVETFKHVICAPHPSYASRFLDVEAWSRQIVAARDYLLENIK